MPSITKDSDALTANQETGARPAPAQAMGSDSAVKQQPVAVEVPVTINGARTMEGSDKREPFSETTKTVLVHGAGAVIRLMSAVTPGQLLFLTNERTKKEVVCQVVKSKNYRSVNGYVELQFTEAAVGFWGMRFPGDRLISAAPAAPTVVRPGGGNGSTAAPRPATTAQLAATKNASSDSAIRPLKPAAVDGGVDSKPVEAKTLAYTSASEKPSAGVPAVSIVPPPLDSAALLGAREKQRNSSVTAIPGAAKPFEETPLVEPWLRKPKPAPTMPVTPPPGEKTPEKNARPSAQEESPAVTPTFGLSNSSNQAASILAPSESPSSLLTVDLSSLARFFEVKPAISTEETRSSSHAPTVGDPEAEELKQHTARLQEQLSNMSFEEAAGNSAAEPAAQVSSIAAAEPAISPSGHDATHESAAQILENASTSSASSVLPEPLQPGEPASQTAYSSSLEALEQEELKIPAWLEPLARNASAPSSTQELVLREKTKRKAERQSVMEGTAEPAALAQEEEVRESRVPDFGSALPIDERKSDGEGTARRSRKGLVFAGLAAAVAVAAGGWWYMNQRSTSAHANLAASQAPAFSAPVQNSHTNVPKEAGPETNLSARDGATASDALSTKSNSGAEPNATNMVSDLKPPSGSATKSRGAQGKPNTVNGGSVVAASASAPVPRESAPVPMQAKKPSLGEVHLAAPKILQNRKSVSGSEADAGVSFAEEQPGGDADSLSAGLAIANSRPAAPAAPAAVGGDVKQAKLLSSVPPVYPTLAKTQHVAGSVVVDALIDANGRVTETKVISGPPLLHEAAVAALRQWKYQPATLDGKPVAMHLSVTIQFRLQQ